MEIESKQRPDNVTIGYSMTNGTPPPSMMSSSDNGSNAWSTAGSAAFDFRSV